MEVAVAVVAFAIVVVAQFVVDDASTILKGMHHIVLSKEGQYTENTRLIQVEHLILKVSEAYGAIELRQCAIDQYAVDSRFDALMLQVVYDRLCIHFSR